VVRVKHRFNAECTHCKEEWIAERRDVYWQIGRYNWDRAVQLAVDEWHQEPFPTEQPGGLIYS
jgi:hypothetical protein